MQTFADEGEEVEFIAGSFQHHRTATVAQRVTVGRAREAFHAIGAKEAMVAGVRVDPGQNFAQVSRDDSKRSAAKAAQTVGLNRETYSKGKKIQDSAPPVVLEQWQQGELSTHAAHQLTTAPKPIEQASHCRDLRHREVLAGCDNLENCDVVPVLHGVAICHTVTCCHFRRDVVPVLHSVTTCYTVAFCHPMPAREDEITLCNFI